MDLFMVVDLALNIRAVNTITKKKSVRCLLFGAWESLWGVLRKRPHPYAAHFNA